MPYTINDTIKIYPLNFSKKLKEEIFRLIVKLNYKDNKRR